MRVTAAAVPGDVAELAARVARLEADVQQLAALLQTSRGPRDRADADVLVAILESVGDRSFTSVDLFAHARAVAPALRAALRAADVASARELGTLCRRLRGVAVRGLRLERLDAYHRAGALWRVRVCDRDSRTRAPLDTV